MARLERLRGKMVRDRTSPRHLFDIKYEVSLSTMEDWRVGRAHLPRNGDNWFADGSKNREGAGLVSMGRTVTQVSLSRWDPTPQFFKPRLRPYFNAHA